ncbi:MAG: membrane dipeptidase [Tannerella sp.]|jgi:microsomal dipeptidase-like Zn-dependent dipeptidase/gamma-glutamyl-gamma-aminobutyrate hydrolase PuuD|nr:membrane dipeptidase [Tannerella sp.]
MKRFFLYLTGACALCQFGHAQIAASFDMDKFRRRVDSCEINLHERRRPLIGLSVTRTGNGGSQVGASYVAAILKTGGVPVVIPAMTDGAALRQLVAELDGLILTGGEDVNPLWYGETPHPQLGKVDDVRDEYEFKLLKLASDRNIPTLGICRGEQLINVYFGGTLYQDISSQRPMTVSLKHRQNKSYESPSHAVAVVPGTQLAAIIGAGRRQVNSMHHQAVKAVAPGFRIAACAADSLIEAIEAWPERPALAVQWHPELLTAGGDTLMVKILRFLVGKADTFRMAKEIHARILSVDAYTGAAPGFRQAGFDFAGRQNGRVNLPRMEEGLIDGVCLTVFVRQGERDSASLVRATQYVTEWIENISGQFEINGDLCEPAVAVDDVACIKRAGKKACFLGIGNGYAIGKSLAGLSVFRKMGVTYMTLCHSYDNDICDASVHTKNEWHGLSPFGEDVVREMNRLGMMIDLAHAGDSTFWDVLKLTKAPVICSRASAHALNDSDHSLTDEQLQAIARNGGVVLVCFPEARTPDRGKSSLTTLVEHIDYIVKTVGADHVGIGSGLDCEDGIPVPEAANDLLRITVELLEKGYGENVIAKIWGGNFLRVMQAVQSIK